MSLPLVSTRLQLRLWWNHSVIWLKWKAERSSVQSINPTLISMNHSTNLCSLPEERSFISTRLQKQWTILVPLDSNVQTCRTQLITLWQWCQLKALKLRLNPQQVLSLLIKIAFKRSIKRPSLSSTESTKRVIWEMIILKLLLESNQWSKRKCKLTQVGHISLVF